MSKIDKLIKEKCLNDIEYKYFYSVAKYIRGITYNKNNETEESDAYKVLRANNITLDSNKLNFDDIKKVYKTVRVKDEQWLKKGDILICAGSGSKEHIGKVAYIKDDINYTFGGFMGVIRCDKKLINPSFMFHILTSNIFRDHIGITINSTTINNINNQTFENFKIPIPPIVIQEEIVRVLDKFGELEADLEANLEAELEVRKGQYEFWCGKLLDIGFERAALKDISFYSSDRISFDELNEDNYVGVDNLLQNKMGKTKSSHVPIVGNSTRFEKDDILIGNIRPYLRKIWIADCYGGTNGDVLDIRVKNKEQINPKFLYYALSSENFFEYNNSNTKGAKMPRGDKQAIMDYVLNVPSLEEQERIVNILDKFDKLVNDISVGLPAEIEARRKQYEYYRNQLLTFKES